MTGKAGMNRRIAWIALGAIVLLSFVWDSVPIEDASERLQAIPERGLGFRSSPLALTEAERAIWKGAGVVKRLYRSGSASFALVVIDGSRNRHAAHDPVYCFAGSGWSVEEERTASGPSGSVNVFRISKGDRARVIAAWYSLPSGCFASPTKYWTMSLARRTTLGLSGPEPVFALLFPMEEGDAGEFDFDAVFADMPWLLSI